MPHDNSMIKKVTPIWTPTFPPRHRQPQPPPPPPPTPTLTQKKKKPRTQTRPALLEQQAKTKDPLQRGERDSYQITAVTMPCRVAGSPSLLPTPLGAIWNNMGLNPNLARGLGGRREKDY